jgi:predicted HicB family RNase H-like nuclease
MHRRARREMLAVKQELHEMVVSAPPDRCTFCGNEGAAGVSIDDGRICLHEILSKSGAGGAHIPVCLECLATDDVVDRIKKAQLEGGAAAKSEEPRCVLCEGKNATGYRIDEEGIVPAFEAEVEADCFLCEECRERDDFQRQVRAYLERRGVYVEWLHKVDKPKEKLDCQLPIRMSKATREKLEVAAKAHGVTLNKLVNGLIEGGLKFLPRKRPAG